METEPASSEGFRSDFCLLDNPNLEYEFRYLYLGKNDFSGEAYFDSIQKLLTGKSAQENGLQFVGKIDSFNKLLKIYSRYAGMGLFFTTVALLTGNKSISIPISYIPGHSYGCPDEDVVPSCDLIGKYWKYKMFYCLFIYFSYFRKPWIKSGLRVDPIGKSFIVFSTS